MLISLARLSYVLLRQGTQSLRDGSVESQVSNWAAVLRYVSRAFSAATWGLKDSFVTRFLALSQQQALKGPLSKLNWIGHAIRSERHKLLTEGSLEFEISFEITKGIESARLPTWSRMPVSTPQASSGCKDQFGGTLLPPCFAGGSLRLSAVGACYCSYRR